MHYEQKIRIDLLFKMILEKMLALKCFGSCSFLSEKLRN